MTKSSELEPTDESLTNKLRSLGWMVAVHNDYRQDGKLRTFWLFTKDGRALKGEGDSDSEALLEVCRQLPGVREIYGRSLAKRNELLEGFVEWCERLDHPESAALLHKRIADLKRELGET